jgi:hypothetical protein
MIGTLIFLAYLVLGGLLAWFFTRFLQQKIRPKESGWRFLWYMLTCLALSFSYIALFFTFVFKWLINRS